MTARIHDGNEWHDVLGEDSEFADDRRPVPPEFLKPGEDGAGKIFVSVVSFRDGERCGKTLIDLFEKAKNPDDIIVGLVEQNTEEDKFCIEVYCQKFGYNVLQRSTLRKDTVKIIARDQRFVCPRANQIRKLSTHNVAAKGPVWARSLVRKVLGNEEYCLQIDAHTTFGKDWDVTAVQEWKKTKNEFGVISTVPPSFNEMESTEVPRQCRVEFMQATGIPMYTARADGKAENLQKPALSRGWNAGFSFSKCHLHESAPYDGYTPYVMGVEPFAMFSRFWTRGYDVYTPTQNFIFHDYAPNADGHGMNEWMKRRRERLRVASFKRIKSYLEMNEEDEDINLSNLGIYGLGKRRSLTQLQKFVGIDLADQKLLPSATKCDNLEWVPFDAKISPVANLYDKPNDLDAQPEFPLRTEPTFYREEEERPLPNMEILESDIPGAAAEVILPNSHLQMAASPHGEIGSPFPSSTLLISLWIFGLAAWCMTFTTLGKIVSGSGGGSKGEARTVTRRKVDMKDK